MNKIVKIAYISIIVLLGSLVSLSIMPSKSFADTTDELISQVRSIRSSVDSTKKEYMSATQLAEQIDAQIADMQSKMKELDNGIVDKRAKLSDILVREYKSPTSTSFIIALGEALNFETVLKQFEYVNKVAEDRVKVIRDITSMTKQSQETLEALELKRDESLRAKETAKLAQSTFNEMLVSIRPQLKDIRDKYLAAAINSSGNEQFEQAMTYLEDVDGTTQAQVALLKSAYRTGYAGADRCESWTEAVYRNAGYDIDRYIGAAQCAKALTRSDDLDVIPVGALVFGSGSSSYMGQKYGHVGICVATGTGNNDALILDNEGSRNKTAVPLSEWSEWQTSVSWVNGKQGAFSWGYPDSVELKPAVL